MKTSTTANNIEIESDLEPVLDRLFYSFDEAARLLSMSIHTLKRDAARGHIQTNGYGRRRLISRAEVLRIASQISQNTRPRDAGRALPSGFTKPMA